MAEIDVLILRTSMNLGGIEQQTLQVLRRLDRSRFRVHLMVFDESGALVSQARDAADAYEFIPRGRNPDLGLLMRVRSYIRTNGIRIVQANNLAEMFYAYFAVLGTKASTIGWIHRVPEQRRKLLHRWVLRRQDCAVFVSDTIKTELTESGWKARRIETIKNGVELNVPTQRKFTPNKLSVCMIARFAPGKDHDTFIKAVSKANNIIGEKRIVGTIVGGGDPKLMKEAESIAESLGVDIEFTGPLTSVKEIMTSSDCLIASSSIESFSLTVVEAMAAGVPVISSDIPAHRELTDNGTWGLLFKTGNANELANHLVSLFSDNDMRSHYRKLGLQRAQSYSIDSTIKETEELFSSLAGGLTS